jgi:hypothetical protein
MAEIVNLRQARKQRDRREKAAQAEQNRALHGRTKAEKARDLHERDAARSHVEAHRRDPAGKEPADR